jgi:hypothetical protein
MAPPPPPPLSTSELSLLRLLNRRRDGGPFLVDRYGIEINATSRRCAAEGLESYGFATHETLESGAWSWSITPQGRVHLDWLEHGMGAESSSSVDRAASVAASLYEDLVDLLHRIGNQSRPANLPGADHGSARVLRKLNLIEPSSGGWKITYPGRACLHRLDPSLMESSGMGAESSSTVDTNRLTPEEAEVLLAMLNDNVPSLCLGDRVLRKFFRILEDHGFASARGYAGSHGSSRGLLWRWDITPAGEDYLHQLDTSKGAEASSTVDHHDDSEYCERVLAEVTGSGPSVEERQARAALRDAQNANAPADVIASMEDWVSRFDAPRPSRADSALAFFVWPGRLEKHHNDLDARAAAWAAGVSWAKGAESSTTEDN